MNACEHGIHANASHCHECATNTVLPPFFQSASMPDAPLRHTQAEAIRDELAWLNTQEASQ